MHTEKKKNKLKITPKRLKIECVDGNFCHFVFVLVRLFCCCWCLVYFVCLCSMTFSFVQCRMQWASCYNKVKIKKKLKRAKMAFLVHKNCKFIAWECVVSRFVDRRRRHHRQQHQWERTAVTSVAAGRQINRCVRKIKKPMFMFKADRSTFIAQLIEIQKILTTIMKHWCLFKKETAEKKNKSIISIEMLCVSTS